MNPTFNLKTALAVAAMLALPLAHATPMTKADYSAAKTRISTDYKANTKACETQAGNAKEVCVKEAKAVEVKALTDAKTSKEVREVVKDGADAKRDANYKVAAEKCEALAGDAKAGCMDAAKQKFGKS